MTSHQPEQGPEERARLFRNYCVQCGWVRAAVPSLFEDRIVDLLRAAERRMAERAADLVDDDGGETWHWDLADRLRALAADSAPEGEDGVFIDDVCCAPTTTCVKWGCGNAPLELRRGFWCCPKCGSSYGKNPHPDLPAPEGEGNDGE